MQRSRFEGFEVRNARGGEGSFRPLAISQDMWGEGERSEDGGVSISKGGVVYSGVKYREFGGEYKGRGERRGKFPYRKKLGGWQRRELESRNQVTASTGEEYFRDHKHGKMAGRTEKTDARGFRRGSNLRGGAGRTPEREAP